MHVYRIQEGYLWYSRSITTLLNKTIQNPRRDELPEKQIWLVRYEKVITVKQYTILWHIRHLKMLHVYFNIFSGVFADIYTEYGKIAKVAITRGKVLKYLGMNINYSSPDKVIFSMVNYIGNMIDDTP